MKSNYKKLGPFIEPVNQLNDGMEVEELLGISNNKQFQNSHTNTIGIDLSTYRIVRTGQFAYNRATTRNGDKISIALRQGSDCIVSPSYRVFRSKDENVLNSEYLMMWFRRPEFDRYARFKSHGSAHEFFEWEQMTEVELPVPPIAKQRELVQEYQAIENRIALNQQLIQKLEETAQAIYREWFVEGIDVEHLPEGWSIASLNELVEIIDGDRGANYPSIEEMTKNGYCLFLNAGNVTKIGFDFSDAKYISKDKDESLRKGKLKKNDVVLTTRGTVGNVAFYSDAILIDNIRTRCAV